MSSLKLALIGAGHLGGSFALALKQAGAELEVTAFDTDRTQAELLQQRGGADHIAPDAASAVAQADIIMLATPLRSYRALAQAIAPYVQPHAIITDLGSVKRSMDVLATTMPQVQLVPGHPIAGGEKTGAAVASGALFKGRICVLTASTATAESIASIETLWHLAGADVLHMPTEVHDTIYAYVSHLPHLIAFVAAEAIYRDGTPVKPDDEMLQKFLRISRSNPRMWTDIFLENREALLSALGTYIALLEHFAKELASGNDAAEPTDAVMQRFVPRILASSLISSVSLYEQQSGMSLRPFGGAGMRDIVAPAAIDPETEMEAISKAAPAVAAALQKVIPLLRQLETLIGAEDEPALFATISDMVAHAHALVSPRQ